MKVKMDEQDLQMALAGYEQERDRIEVNIDRVKHKIRSTTFHTMTPVAGKHKKHNISAAGRKAIAEAQRRRWAAQKANA